MKVFILAVVMFAFTNIASADQATPPADTESILSAALEKIQHGQGRDALALLLPLAKQGNPEAAYWLGRLHYYDVPGVPRSWPKAFRWFAQAAKTGHADAQYKLGGMYFTARGVARDIRKTIHWWRLAALQRQPEALNNLGALLATGQGLQRDEELGLALQILAADLGSESALENVRNKKAAAVAYFSTSQAIASSLANHPDALAVLLTKSIQEK